MDQTKRFFYTVVIIVLALLAANLALAWFVPALIAASRAAAGA